MATQSGQLRLPVIVAIFFVVFGLIHGTTQLQGPELVRPDPTTEREDQLRSAIWDELNDRRASNGIERMQHDQFMRGIAQDTTDTLVADQLAAQTPPDAVGELPLSNDRLFCTQVSVRVSLASPTRPPNEVAVAVVDALESADRTGVIFRPAGQFHAGMGIAIHDGAVYVVYRSCERVDT